MDIVNVNIVSVLNRVIGEVTAVRDALNTVGTQPTSTNTASFQLPLTMESCIEHLRAMWGDIHITAEVRCAVEETHDFIERQLQTLL